MTWKDKLEIGLKEDAPYRKDNLPPTCWRQTASIHDGDCLVSRIVPDHIGAGLR